jgi:hypothetical protein
VDRRNARLILASSLSCHRFVKSVGDLCQGIVVAISTVDVGPERRLDGLKIGKHAPPLISFLPNGFVSRVAMPCNADLGSLQTRTPSPANSAYNDSDGKLLAVGQTVGQPARTVRDMSDLAHAPDATVAAVHAQRFCPDTEEVTGSNPVSPTSISPSRGPVFGSMCSFTARYAPVSSGDFDLETARGAHNCAHLSQALPPVRTTPYPLLALYSKSKLRSISAWTRSGLCWQGLMWSRSPPGSGCTGRPCIAGWTGI